MEKQMLENLFRKARIKLVNSVYTTVEYLGVYKGYHAFSGVYEGKDLMFVGTPQIWLYKSDSDNKIISNFDFFKNYQLTKKEIERLKKEWQEIEV